MGNDWFILIFFPWTEALRRRRASHPRGNLTQAIRSSGTSLYAYDPNGNRLSFLDNGETKNYAYSPNTNRLTQVGHKDVVLDAAGNTLSKENGKWKYEYGQSGRLLKVYKGRKQVATYLYNAQSQRTQKITKHGTTVYHYDLSGHLIAETSKTGDLIRAYVWLEDMPLAQIDIKGHHDDKGKGKHKTKERIAYLHTDHLGTPRLATDVNQQVVWRWNSDAFGSEKPEHADEVDDDHKDITVNLRFAGQYFDSESGLYYNWNRYYDPKTGRYITSDPIGLAGGMNTFLYANANPLRFTDPDGLLGQAPGRGPYPSGEGPGTGPGPLNPNVDSECWLRCQATEAAICSAIGAAGFGMGMAIGGIASIPSGGTTAPLTIPAGALIGQVSASLACRATVDLKCNERCEKPSPCSNR